MSEITYALALRAARKAAGLSYRKASRLLCLSAAFLSDIEKGARWPSPKMALRIQEKLGVSEGLARREKALKLVEALAAEVKSGSISVGDISERLAPN